MCHAEAVQKRKVVKNSELFRVVNSKKKKKEQGCVKQEALGSDTGLIKNEKRREEEDLRCVKTQEKLQNGKIGLTEFTNLRSLKFSEDTCR